MKWWHACVSLWRPCTVGEDGEGFCQGMPSMKLYFLYARIAVPAAVLVCVLPTSAQTATPAPMATLAEVVVTATRVLQPLTDLVADVTIVDRSQIERSGATGLGDVLARLPGIEMGRNGGIGGITSVYVRGAETRFTAVFIDGVRVDSQGTGGASWDVIPLSQVDRIEVLRGPAGAVYGSDAMGGVIQIFTRKGEGPASPYVGLSLGTYGTTKAEAGVSGSQGSWDYALSLVRQESKGFSVMPSRNPDDDGYTSESLAARVGLELNASHRLDLSVLSSQLNAQYDSQFGAINVDDRTVKKLQTSALSWRAQWSADYSSTVSVNRSQDRYETLPSPDLTVTNMTGYLFQNEYRRQGHVLTWTLERRDNELSNSETTPRDSSHVQNALALGYGWSGSGHSVQMNLRHDLDSVFGPQTTGALGYGYALSPNWRIKAAAGTAFRAPTLYQRFSPYGAADLLPETSRNLDLGLNYAEGPRAFGLTLYQNNVSNLIQYEGSKGTCPTNVPSDPRYDPDFGGCYANTAKARYQGMTLTGRYLIGHVTVSGSLDLQDPRDSVSGNLLPRRAQQHGKLAAETRVQGWAVGAEVQASGLRYNDAGNITELPGYALLGLRAESQVAKNWTLLVRLDNATDAKYELAQGYASAGRSLYAGLTWAR